MEQAGKFDKLILKIDVDSEIGKICDFISQQVSKFNREGIVIGLSGGIDSAVAAALCVKAVGPDNVFGLILPEKDSNPVSEQYAIKEIERLGINYEKVDITNVLTSFGTYSKRDSIIKSLLPEYNESYSIKLSLPSDLLDKDAYNIFKLTIENSAGKSSSVRLMKNDLQGIVAATNTKQRTRMMNLYYYAESKNYLVCGTTNKTEYLQGFFVKYGDSGVDIEPLMHLYKNQIYQLADSLGVIEEIKSRKPSPDTYSSHVSDEEFYFRIPFEKLDMLLYSWENKIPIENICSTMDLTEEQVRRAFRDFNGKQIKTEHQKILPPSLL